MVMTLAILTPITPEDDLPQEAESYRPGHFKAIVQKSMRSGASKLLGHFRSRGGTAVPSFLMGADPDRLLDKQGADKVSKIFGP